MNRITTAITGLSLAFASTAFSFADTIHVPTEFSTIQAALDAASDGDTIQVAAGKQYESNIMVSGISVTISGAVDKAGMPATSVIGNQTTTVLSTEVSTGDSIVIENLIITGGHGVDAGGGMDNVSLDGSGSVLVRNVRIISNTSEGTQNVACVAAGMAISYNRNNNGSGDWSAELPCDYIVHLIDCQVSHNVLQSHFGGNGGSVYAGGIVIANCAPILDQCLIESNVYQCDGPCTVFSAVAGGIASTSYYPPLSQGCGPVLNGCKIRSNTINAPSGELYHAAGGVTSGWNASMTLNHCTLCGNRSHDFYGQSAQNASTTANLYLNNCVQAASCVHVPDGTLYDLVMQQQADITLLQDALAACCAERCTGDVDYDQDVDINDILLLLANYGLGCR